MKSAGGCGNTRRLQDIKERFASMGVSSSDSESDSSSLEIPDGQFETMSESSEGEEDAKVEPIVKVRRPPVPMFVDGETYRFRKRVGSREYFYCAVRGCGAGCVVNRDTGFVKRNKAQHTHKEEMQTEQLSQNLAEISLRLFVREHWDRDSRSIYSLLLADDFHDKYHYEHFPDIASIDLKRIQNIKTLLAGQVSRDVLHSSLPPDMAEIDGRQFLTFQCVQPVCLIFATNAMLESFARIRQCLLKRLNLCGNVIKFVYCIYAVVGQHVTPAAWILLDQKSSYPWSHLKMRLRECNNNGLGVVARAWCVPCTSSYLEILTNVLESEDSVMGIFPSYLNKIQKILSCIKDKETHDSLEELFISVTKDRAAAIPAMMERASSQYPSSDARQAIASWCAKFSNQRFLCHSTNLCEAEPVKQIYNNVKRTPKRMFDTDRELIYHIHDLCKEAGGAS